MLVSDNELDAVEKAMMHAGGKWAGKKDEHQFKPNLERCDTGWVRYAFGEQAAVKKAITGPAYVITNSLRGRAQSTYNIVREIMAGRGI